MVLTGTFHQVPGPGPGQGLHSQGPGQGQGLEQMWYISVKAFKLMQKT